MRNYPSSDSKSDWLKIKHKFFKVLNNLPSNFGYLYLLKQHGLLIVCKLEKLAFPKLKILLPTVCTWIFFELEKLSFPKLKILLPQVWTWIFFELEKLSFPNLRFYFTKYTKSSLNLISISKLRVLFLQVDPFYLRK